MLYIDTKSIQSHTSNSNIHIRTMCFSTHSVYYTNLKTMCVIILILMLTQTHTPDTKIAQHSIVNNKMEEEKTNILFICCPIPPLRVFFVTCVLYCLPSVRAAISKRTDPIGRTNRFFLVGPPPLPQHNRQHHIARHATIHQTILFK